MYTFLTLDSTKCNTKNKSTSPSYFVIATLLHPTNKCEIPKRYMTIPKNMPDDPKYMHDNPKKPSLRLSGILWDPKDPA